MYRTESGYVVYETLNELLTEDIRFVSEYEGYYYVKLKPREFHDNTIWKVDKKTGKVSYMMYTEYFAIEDAGAIPINPSTLRRRA